MSLSLKIYAWLFSWSLLFQRITDNRRYNSSPWRCVQDYGISPYSSDLKATSYPRPDLARSLAWSQTLTQAPDIILPKWRRYSILRSIPCTHPTHDPSAVTPLDRNDGPKTQWKQHFKCYYYCCCCSSSSSSSYYDKDDYYFTNTCCLYRCRPPRSPQPRSQPEFITPIRLSVWLPW